MLFLLLLLHVIFIYVIVRKLLIIRVLFSKESSMIYKYKYVVNEEGSYSFESVIPPQDSIMLESVVEDAAEDYFTNNDGWEDEWPLEFMLFYEGKRVFRAVVSMDTEPVFSAVEKMK